MLQSVEEDPAYSFSRMHGNHLLFLSSTCLQCCLIHNPHFSFQDCHLPKRLFYCFSMTQQKLWHCCLRATIATAALAASVNELKRRLLNAEMNNGDRQHWIILFILNRLPLGICVHLRPVLKMGHSDMWPGPLWLGGLMPESGYRLTNSHWTVVASEDRILENLGSSARSASQNAAIRPLCVTYCLTTCSLGIVAEFNNPTTTFVSWRFKHSEDQVMTEIRNMQLTLNYGIEHKNGMNEQAHRRVYDHLMRITDRVKAGFGM